MKATLRTQSGAQRLTFHPPGYATPMELPVITNGSRDESGCWTWNGDTEKPTLRPSIRTRHGVEGGKVSHFWLTGGVCHFLEDSTDGNAGQSLPLLELDESTTPARTMLKVWKTAQPERNTILEFWEWLCEQREQGDAIRLLDINKVLDEYQRIDKAQLERERRALLESVQLPQSDNQSVK